MATPEQAGKNYEQKLLDIVKPIFGSENTPKTVAGSSLYPDIFVKDQFRNMIRIEVKTDIGADFGQRGITLDKESKKWVPVKKEYSTRSNFTKKLDKLYDNIFDELNLNQKIIDAWNLPSKNSDGIDVAALIYLIETKQLNKVLNYERMLTRFEKKFDPYQETTLVRSVLNSIEEYYNSLNTFYIQIEDKGFYYLGQDKNNLNQKLREKGFPFIIPKFNPTESKLNLRGKTSTSGQYFRPVIRFKISGLSKSSVSLEDNNFIMALYQTLWS